MARTITLFLSLLFLLHSIGSVAQESKTTKKIAKIDRKYLAKDKYKQGIKKARKLDKQLSAAGETPEESFAMNAMLNRAYLLNGNPIKATEYYEKALSSSSAIAVYSYSNPGTLYINNGRYNDAVVYLKDKQDLESKIRLHKALVMQGNLVLANQLESELSSTLESQKSTISTLNKKEKAQFYDNYYHFQIQFAERLQQQGNYDTAIGLLLSLRKEVLRNTSKNSDLKSDYFENLGKIALDNGEFELAEALFDDALENHLKRHKIHHPKSVELLAYCLQTYYLLGKDRKLLDQVKQHYAGLDYYRNQRSSINTLPLLLAEIERKVGEGDFREADRTAEALMLLGKNFENTPDPKIYSLYSNLYTYFITRDNYDDAVVCLDVLAKMSPVLFGQNSPVNALQKLQFDQFQINYQFDRTVLADFNNPAIWNVYTDNYGVRHYKYLSFINSKAQAYALGDQLNEQTSTLKEGVKTAEETYGQSSSWARQLVVLAEAELNRGNFPPVPVLINQALPVLEQKDGKNSLSYLTASRVLAEYYENTGRLDEAKEIYKKTFRRLDRLSRRAGVNSFSQPEKMAQVFLLTGDYNTAEKQLEQAIEQKTKTYGAKTKIVLIEPYVLSAKLNYFKGNYIAAQENAQKAIEIGRELNMENSLKIQQANRILADVDYAIGDYRTAQRRLDKIIIAQEKTLGHNNPLVATSLLKLSLASYYSDGNVAVNKARVDDASAILTSTLGANSLQLAEAMVYQAMFSMELNQYDSALMALQQAQQIYGSQLAPGSRESARIVCLEGDILSRQNKFSEADAKYKQSAEVYKKLLGKTHPDYLKTQSKIARVRCKEGRFTEAFVITQTLTDNYQKFVEQVFPYLSEREKAKYWQQLREDFDLYYALAVEVAPNDQKVLKKVLNSRVNTKALLLRSSVKFQKDVRAANDESVTALFDKWLAQRRQIAASFGLSPEELAESGINLIELEAEATYNEKELRRKLYGKTETNAGDHTAGLFTKLGKDRMLVETIRFTSLANPEHSEYAFIIADPSSKKLSAVVLENGAELEGGLYRYYKNAIRLSAMDKYSYQNFWDALDNKLPDGKTIFFSPDGVYGLMNPETFADGEGKYVLEKNSMIILNNPGDLLTETNHPFPANLQAELVGNPSFYPTATTRKHLVKDLPATGEEIIAVNAILVNRGATTEMMTQNMASEDSVKHIYNPGILHFATHGYFEEDNSSTVTSGGLSEEETGKHPLLQSGLMLANSGPLLEKDEENMYAKDGILTAFEAKDLELGNTELVVLSACETGVGRVSVGEGVVGLQRAFLDAGSNSVMMSLFKVNDQATKELMESFYKNWIDTGNKQQALVMAKKEMKEKYKEPILWGSFILVGN